MYQYTLSVVKPGLGDFFFQTKGCIPPWETFQEPFSSGIKGQSEQLILAMHRSEVSTYPQVTNKHYNGPRTHPSQVRTWSWANYLNSSCGGGAIPPIYLFPHTEVMAIIFPQSWYTCRKESWCWHQGQLEARRSEKESMNSEKIGWRDFLQDKVQKYHSTKTLWVGREPGVSLATSHTA